MSARRRAFVVVLDACGAGELPDAAAYGDAGANTLVHVADLVGGLRLPALQGLGLGCVRPIAGVPPASAPVLHGRLHPLGPGKDSTTGHWELMGVVTPHALPTFPEGFPPEILAALERTTGHRFCCNRPYDGMAAIRDFGEEHLRSGRLILYTSQDSVLQLAAHVDCVAEPALCEAAAKARAVMQGEHAVGRVIARPFAGAPGGFHRTEGRKDLSVPPPTRSYLQELQDRGVPVHAVGKVADLFDGVGIDVRHRGATNAQALEETTRLVEELDHGLVFTNLIETDQVYGHRKDAEGFHTSLQATDRAVARWLELLRPDDLLVLTADHGVDPLMAHSDHTREHAPLLAVFDGHRGRRHDGPMSDVGASVLQWLAGSGDDDADAGRALPGRPFPGLA
jgi:phosphopentomutase